MPAGAELLINNLADVLWCITALHASINKDNPQDKQIPGTFKVFEGHRVYAQKAAGFRLTVKDVLVCRGMVYIANEAGCTFIKQFKRECTSLLI